MKNKTNLSCASATNSHTQTLIQWKNYCVRVCKILSTRRQSSRSEPGKFVAIYSTKFEMY